MKKLLSILMAAILLVCLLPAGAFALSENSGTITVNENAELVSSGTDTVISPTSAGSTSDPIVLTGISNITVNSSCMLTVKTDYTTSGTIRNDGTVQIESGVKLTIAGNGSYGGNGETGGSGVLRYEVKYNDNGGSGAPATVYKTLGSTLTLDATGPTTAPTGKKFLGWSNASDAVTAQYSSATSFVYTSLAPVTLYAVWGGNSTPSASYKVTYSGNGSTGGTAPVDNTSYASGTRVTVLGNTGNLRKNDLLLWGWATSSDAASPAYYPGAGFIITTNTTLHAVWAESVQLKYHENVGTNSRDVTMIYPRGETLRPVHASDINFQRDGYTFAGWATTAAATSAAYKWGDTITVATDTTLYAVWTSTAKYTVTYNGNSGTPGVASATVTSGSAVTLPSATRSGYKLLGWATTSGATSAAYSAGASYTPTANVTLYAVWQQTVTVSYYSSVTGAALPASSTVDKGGSVTVGTAVLGGYKLKGYGNSSSATAVSYYAGSTYKFDADATLYALWEYTGLYTVTYDANGGTGAPAATSYSNGQTATVAFTPMPTRAGYTFLGWSTSSVATTATYTSGGVKTFTIGTANVTLYAVWSYSAGSTAYNSAGNIWLNDVAAGSSLTSTALSSSSSSYKKLKKAAGSGATVLCAYDIKHTTGFTGVKQLVFNFGTAYAGRAMTVLHLPTSSKINYYNVTADANGYVAVNVSSLSPFMVLSGTITEVKTDIPATADENNIPVWGILMAIMLCLAAIAALYGTLAYGKRKDAKRAN